MVLLPARSSTGAIASGAVTAPNSSASMSPATARRPSLAGTGTAELNGRRQVSSSAYDAGLAAGSFARQRRTTADKPAVMTVPGRLGGAGGSVATRVSSAISSRSSNGGWPVSR